MGAELIHQAVAALGIAESHQTLGEELDPHRWAIVLRQFLGEERRHPIGAEHLAHGGAGAGLGEKFVLFFSEHGLIRAASPKRVGIWALSGKLSPRLRLPWKRNYAKSAGANLSLLH